MSLDAHAIALVEVVASRKGELAEQVVDRLQAELPTYAVLPRAELISQLEIGVSFVSEMLTTEGTGSPTMLAAFAELGRTRAHEGVDSATLIRGVRIAARVAMEFAQTLATGTEMDTEATFTLATALWDWVEVIADRLSPTDRGADEQRARDVAALRLVKACVGGEATADQISTAATSCQLDPTAIYHVFRAHASDRPAANLALDVLRPTTGNPGVVAVIADEVIAILSAPPLNRPVFPVGVGPALPLTSARRGYLIAGRVLRAATLQHKVGVFRLEDIGLPLLVADETDLGDMLVQRYVTPLAGLGVFGEELLDSVRRYFALNLNIDDTAKSLHIHSNTLRHRLTRFEEATGASLRQPEHIAEIWWVLERTQLSTSL